MLKYSEDVGVKDCFGHDIFRKSKKKESSMKKRESFNSRWGFILACIGSAVGMGNIWMFPTRVSLYGGGSFLIPYFLFVALIGFTGVSGEMSLAVPQIRSG